MFAKICGLTFKSVRKENVNLTEWQEKHDSGAELWVSIAIFKNPVRPARPPVSLFYICQPSADVSHSQGRKIR